MEAITDFQPDLVTVFIGTNDLFHEESCQTAAKITDLVDVLLYMLEIPKVVVCQTLYRIHAVKPTKYSVDLTHFNLKADKLNRRLKYSLKEISSSLWRLKGFWADKSLQTAFSTDGVHLSD